MTLRTVVAEDNLLVREGLLRLLQTIDDVEVVGACTDYFELMETVQRDRPDVVITDIRMPPEGTDEGIRAARELRAILPELGVVVVSQYAEPHYALALLDDGSAGRAYLLKERISDPVELANAIREVARGGSVIDPLIVETLVHARASRRESPLDRLTPREREVLEQMAQGRNNAGIAAELHLSERAVEKHINSLFSKIGVSEEREVHRRVKAVLLFLAEQGS